MKFSNKYNTGKSIKKQMPSHPDYWLSAEKHKRKPITKRLKKADVNQMFPDYQQQNVLKPVNNNINQLKNAPVNNNNNNKQLYTGIDKNFQFNNNMMNMYRAAVNNARNG